MAQVTIYLDPDTEARMAEAAKQSGLSKSRWIAKLIRERTRTTWPDHVAALAGAWPDLPEAEELRRGLGQDTEREEF